MCGGTWENASASLIPYGLSPRVRGNLILTLPQHLHSRSIPACAGEPDEREFESECGAVYPRVCGGTSTIGGEPHTDQGLSPRVRGNPHIELMANTMARSIPACAGEPDPPW